MNILQNLHVVFFVKIISKLIVAFPQSRSSYSILYRMKVFGDFLYFQIWGGDEVCSRFRGTRQALHSQTPWLSLLIFLWCVHCWDCLWLCISGMGFWFSFQHGFGNEVVFVVAVCWRKLGFGIDYCKKGEDRLGLFNWFFFL